MFGSDPLVQHVLSGNVPRVLLALSMLISVCSGFLTSSFPLLRSHRQPFWVRRSSSTVDADEVDYSGQALSGAWNLEYNVDGHQVPARMVSLLPSGKFLTPPDGPTTKSKADSGQKSINVEVLDGAWSVDPETQEFSVAIYGIAKNVKIWFIGNIDVTGSVVSGVVGEVSRRKQALSLSLSLSLSSTACLLVSPS